MQQYHEWLKYLFDIFIIRIIILGIYLLYFVFLFFISSVQSCWNGQWQKTGQANYKC